MKFWMAVSVTSFFLMAASLLLLPLDTDPLNDSIGTYSLLAGILFWLFLIVGCITQVILSRFRKRWWMAHPNRRRSRDKKPGVISFFGNLPAAIADLVFVISLIGLVASLIATNALGRICYVFLSLTIFSFCMHCILNGKIYFTIQSMDNAARRSERIERGVCEP